MYPKEQPHPAPKESWPAGLPKYEDIRPKERDLLGKMWTAAGDFVRDVDTANKMAKDKFEGDTALMHAARGAVTTGVGMGLEKAMDYVWDSVWKGDIPFYDKAKFNPKMAEALNKFALANEKNARLTYFIKEATQDLSISLFYNFMAFRSQPILPKAGPGHLIASIGADAVEAMVRPTLPHEVNQAAQAGIVGMTENQIENKRREWLNFMRNGKVTVPFRAGETRDGEAIVRTMSKNVLEAETNQAKAELDDLMKGRDAAELKLNEYIRQSRLNQPGNIEKFLKPYLKASNPVTMMGMEWMASGVGTLIGNIIAVRKARNERGGLSGKKVFMPREDKYHRDDYRRRDEYHKRDDNRSWQDRRPQQDRRQDDRQGKDRVYYGKGRSDAKKLEEYELKGA